MDPIEMSKRSMEKHRREHLRTDLDPVACLERVRTFVRAERNRSKSVDELATVTEQLIDDILRTD